VAQPTLTTKASRTRRYSAAVPRPSTFIIAAALSSSLFFAGAAPSGASTRVPSATQLVKDSVTAANKAGAMSFSDKSTSGKQTTTLVGAASGPTAVESLAQNGTTQLQIELIGGAIYVRATAGVLESALSLPAAASTANSGKWISVQSSDSAFETLASQLTLEAELDAYIPTAHLQKGKIITVAGHRVIPVSGEPSSAAANGATSGSAALLVSTKAPYLPVGGSLILAKTGAAELKEVAVFGNWGKKLPLTAPPGATAFSSLVG
jgi:hypothetical protein